MQGGRFDSMILMVSSNRNGSVIVSQLAGGAVMAVGTWTLAEKSDYISLLSSSTYSATAYILVVAGVVVMVTGILGCCATFKERRNLLRVVSFAPLFCLDGGIHPIFP